jgi:hypothetical protein
MDLQVLRQTTTLQRRINPISCKWLKRPHIAMGEFAATVVENLNWLFVTSRKAELSIRKKRENEMIADRSP